MKYESKVGKVK